MSDHRYVILDHFLDGNDLAHADAVWPAPDWPGWVGLDRLDPAYADKRASNLETPLPPFLATLLARMAAADLGALVGLPGCVADLSLVGAGLFAYPPGGGLASHVDADTHRRLGLRRTWSAVLYAHPAWDAGWRGELVLEHPDGTGYRAVACVPGRLVVFDSRERRHRVEAVTCPEGVERRCLALFGYAPEPGPGLRRRADFARVA